MAATVSTFINKGGQISMVGTCSPSFKKKLEVISFRFATLQRFKHASIELLNSFTTEEGTRCFNPLTPKEATAIKSLQNEINVDWSIEKNFIHLFTKKFIAKQIRMIEDLTIESLNTNPLLCYALKFENAVMMVCVEAHVGLNPKFYSRSIIEKYENAEDEDIREFFNNAEQFKNKLLP